MDRVHGLGPPGWSMDLTGQLRLSVHFLNMKTQLYFKTNHNERRANDDAHFFKTVVKMTLKINA